MRHHLCLVAHLQTVLGTAAAPTVLQTTAQPSSPECVPLLSPLAVDRTQYACGTLVTTHSLVSVLLNPRFPRHVLEWMVYSGPNGFRPKQQDLATSHTGITIL